MGVINPLDCSNILVAETIKSIVNKNYLEKLLDYRHPLGCPYHRWLQKNGSALFHGLPLKNIL
ncbi:hypothetical protein [Clostridium sporogenes]|uniref:hypothetical protein n=1 Tax=Clostridium sporogenes TaxID=1509 RepID=UPI001FA86780|nr:hypothetical protein [Clostridium sporogenes]